jgi:hypothetical protein
MLLYQKGSIRGAALILYYIVKTEMGYAILGMTVEEMIDRVRADPLLGKSLDRAPFKTRGEAEQRRAELMAGLDQARRNKGRVTR